VLTTADGVRLEAETSIPPDPWASVVLAHPHPLFGGSMRTGVPAALFERLPGAGIACLRFNFRGVEGSEGTHGEGVDERLDAQAAVDALAAEVPGVPLVVAGWSFGGDVSLTVTDAALAGWCAIAAPLAVVPLDDMAAARDPRPKRLLVPEHDQYRRPDAARTATATWVGTEVVVIPGADHFLAGRLAAVGDAVVGFLESL
jgi:alpha/beta superfamily hydrolase